MIINSAGVQVTLFQITFIYRRCTGPHLSVSTVRVTLALKTFLLSCHLGFFKLALQQSMPPQLIEHFAKGEQDRCLGSPPCGCAHQVFGRHSYSQFGFKYLPGSSGACILVNHVKSIYSINQLIDNGSASISTN